jgi:hypothetical protein
LGVSSLSTPGCLSVALQTTIKKATLGSKEKRTRRDGKHCQQPCPAIREESMGPNTYYQRRSRPSGHDRPQVPPTPSTTRPVGQRATYVPAHRSGAEAHGYRHMDTSESDAIHHGQTQDVELGRHRTSMRPLKCGKPITNLLHAESTPSQKPGEGFRRGSAVPYRMMRET